MNQEKTTFRSNVNGIAFDSHNPTTNMLLGNHNKSQFVSREDGKAKVGKGQGKAKVVVADEAEQELH